MEIIKGVQFNFKKYDNLLNATINLNPLSEAEIILAFSNAKFTTDNTLFSGTEKPLLKEIIDKCQGLAIPGSVWLNETQKISRGGLIDVALTSGKLVIDEYNYGTAGTATLAGSPFDQHPILTAIRRNESYVTVGYHELYNAYLNKLPFVMFLFQKNLAEKHNLTKSNYKELISHLFYKIKKEENILLRKNKL